MALTAGTRLGHYHILAAIGAGGMGEVYRARDTKLGRDVAIKILPIALTTDPDRLARFEREAHILASLNHPNIATIHGVEDSGDQRALVLELVDGETLAEKIGGLSVTEALAIARQIVDALDAAHEQAIVHRDLKPANIKITPAGVVKVLDFGLAKAGVAGTAQDLSQSPTVTVATRDGVLLGTAPYMSPEQARGRIVDKRTDIWAFGCVLYEMLAGTPAFARHTVSDTIAAILERDPDWSALPSTMPSAATRLLRRCLEKDSRRRLRDIADARQDLEDASAGAGPGTAADDQTSTPRGGRALWFVGGAVVAALAAALVGRATGSNGTVDVAPALSHPLKITNSVAYEFGPAISPDGKWVSYYANTGGRTDLWVKFLESGATTNLTANLKLELPLRSGVGATAISPDGSQIAFLARQEGPSPSYDTWVIPAPVGGTPRKLFQVFQACQWSPDGGRILCIRPASTKGDALVVANSDGSDAHDIVSQQPGRHIHWPAWSRDGQYIYFIHTYDNWHNEPSEIYRVPAAGGAIEPVVQSVRRAIYPVPLPGGELLFAGNPETMDLGLWWKPAGGAREKPLTIGLGEYAEPQLSADGRKLVATLVSTRQLLFKLPAAAGSSVMQPLTDGFGGELDPSLDPRTDRLVFSSARAGHRSLWLARADAGDARPLTTASAIDERPSFSPDGQQIAFVSDRGGRRAIWVMSAAGGAPKKLAEAIVLDTLTWSPDGTRVIFARPEGNRTGLASVSLADGSVVPIATPEDACCPAASPAAKAIAYLQPTMVPAAGPSGSAAARLWLRFIDAGGRLLHQDMPDQQFANGFLAWSPDGTRLAAANVTNGLSEIWLIEPGTSQPYRRIFRYESAGRPRGLTWTRDGTSLIVASQEFPADIVMFDVTSSK